MERVNGEMRVGSSGFKRSSAAIMAGMRYVTPWKDPLRLLP